MWKKTLRTALACGVYLFCVALPACGDDAPEPAKSSMEAFEKAAAPLAVRSHLVKSFSVDEGIRYLADELGVKLIGIGNHARKPLRRMLIGSVVEALVNHSDLPVLAVGLKKTI